MNVSAIYEKSYPPYMFVRFNSGLELRVWAYSSRDFGVIERKKYEYPVSQKKTLLALMKIIMTYCDESEKSILDNFYIKFRKLGASGDRLRKKVLNWKDYDLWKEIDKNPWKKDNPNKKAREWLNKVIKPDTEFHFRKGFLTQGKLYIFDYDTPKYEDILPWFDTQPLIISLGPIDTSLGKRNLGLNMHLLPPNIRRIVMYQIFDLYRNQYKNQLFEKDQKNVLVKWKDIVQPLFKYGIAFCIRMYIPELMKNIIEFKYENWKDAIYIESKGLSKISFEALSEEWKKFVRNQKQKGLNESWIKS